MTNMMMSKTVGKPPDVGDGATLCMWSDRYAATVVAVSKGGHKITLREDQAVRTDGRGMSDSQTYDYYRDPNGRVFTANLTRDGRWRSRSGYVLIGTRRAYYDYSF